MTEATWTSLINNTGYSQQNVGVALASSITNTDISPGAHDAGEALLIPQGYLQASMQVRVVARGVVSTTGSPNITLGLYYGGVAGVALASSTFAASANLSNNVWSVTADVRVETVGATGTVRTLGALHGFTTGAVMLPQTASGGSLATIDTGTAKVLTLGAQWGTSSASNSIQVLEWLVEQLN